MNSSGNCLDPLGPRRHFHREFDTSLSLRTNVITFLADACCKSSRILKLATRERHLLGSSNMRTSSPINLAQSTKQARHDKKEDIRTRQARLHKVGGVLVLDIEHLLIHLRV